MAWWSSLSGLDLWTASMILATAVGYGGVLLAAGSVLLRYAMPELVLTPGGSGSGVGVGGYSRGYGLTVTLTSLVAITALALQWPLQAGYLGGGNLESALDPILLGIVFQGPMGERLILAVIGLLLLQAVLLDTGRDTGKDTGRETGEETGEDTGESGSKRRFIACATSLAGVVLVLLAFTRMGHTMDEPRWLLGGLLFLHLLTAAFWVGALAPLYRLVGKAAAGSDTDLRGQAARALERFGRMAVVMVGVLVAAGVTLAWWLVGGLWPLLTTAYGQILLAKVGMVALLLLLAALNKWRLVPAFEHGQGLAGRSLRRSILLEGALVAMILLTTALLTTTASPSG